MKEGQPRRIDLGEIHPQVFKSISRFAQENEKILRAAIVIPKLEERDFIIDYESLKAALRLSENEELLTKELLAKARVVMAHVFSQISPEKRYTDAIIDHYARSYLLINLAAGAILGSIPEVQQVLEGEGKSFDFGGPSALAFTNQGGKVEVYYRYEGHSELPAYRTHSFVLPENSWMGIGYYLLMTNLDVEEIGPYEKFPFLRSSPVRPL